MNKIETLKAERDGLDVSEDLVRFAREGWKTIGDDDKERLKWVGVFYRRPTPGHFMLRIRMANGIVTAAQARLLGEITKESGRNIADVTTRQQVQLRWVTVEGVPEVMARLDLAHLTGRFEAGAVVDARIAAQHPSERLTEVTFDDGRFWVPEIAGAAGARVRVRIRARDVMLALAEPHGISANNLTLSGRDPISQQPELKACAVRLRRVAEPHV